MRDFGCHSSCPSCILRVLSGKILNHKVHKGSQSSVIYNSALSENLSVLSGEILNHKGHKVPFITLFTPFLNNTVLKFISNPNLQLLSFK